MQLLKIYYITNIKYKLSLYEFDLHVKGDPSHPLKHESNIHESMSLHFYMVINFIT